jgi:hypothetical protein
MADICRIALLVVLGPVRSLAESSSLPKADIGKRMEQSGDVQDPQNHGDDHNAVKD